MILFFSFFLFLHFYHLWSLFKNRDLRHFLLFFPREEAETDDAGIADETADFAVPTADPTTTDEAAETVIEHPSLGKKNNVMPFKGKASL